MFAFLKAPPDAAPISDKRELDERYRYWRRHILLTIWLGYALFYFTRKSFNAAVPEILASNVLTRSDIGLLATLFYITYGLSKFFSGIVSDRSDARYFMGLWLMPFASYVMQAACFFTTGFFVFGPQMLIGMAAAECSHKEAAGAATGFVGLFAYLGASLSGWPLAQVMDIWHWTGFFVVIAIAAGISALLLLPFLNAQAPRTASEA